MCNALADNLRTKRVRIIPLLVRPRSRVAILARLDFEPVFEGPGYCRTEIMILLTQPALSQEHELWSASWKD